eukprot:TRINITY_DN87894_c0_g1_i1.p1 TRINITY_DN87894_c0_g1~~TRINITY_DN87894_c0_g1_i1.p1  ORF type:complete len:433 (-),score=69.35 TRINITY_DN87894_c0_g1_i1:74-1372(-)
MHRVATCNTVLVQRPITPMRARPSAAQSFPAAYPALVVGHITTKPSHVCNADTITRSQNVRLPARVAKTTVPGAATLPHPAAFAGHRIQKPGDLKTTAKLHGTTMTPPPYPVLLGSRPAAKPTTVGQQGRTDVVLSRSSARLPVAAKNAAVKVTETLCASTSTPRATSRSAPSRAATPQCTPRAREGTLDVGVLQLGGSPFNPTLPHVRSRLLAALGASQSCSIKASEGFAGGMNEGIWFMDDGTDQLVLKLVKFDPKQPAQFVEADSFQKLYKEIPELATDESVAFPVKILTILGSGNSRQHDLIVMRRVPGQSLDRVLFDHKQRSKMSDLKDVFKRVAESLCKLHLRYDGRQHSDAGPQNIFYDEATKQVRFIDVGFIGIKTRKTDVEHFSSAIKRLAEVSYGDELLEALSHFELSYAEAKSNASVLINE